MIYRKLGNIEQKVSVIGYGGWALGQKGWQGVNEGQSRKTLQLAYESGINFFDTAPIYGLGKSEEIIGEELSYVRKNIIIATKFGLVWNQGDVRHDISRDSILREIEQSLKRLKTDYIDLYQLHWNDNKTSFEETFSTLNRLREEGVIREIGVSNLNKDEMVEALHYSNITSLQSEYNWLQRDVEKEVLPFCNERKIGFIAYSPLAQGLLSGKVNTDYNLSKNDIRRFNPFFTNKEIMTKALNKIKKLDNPLEVALKFLVDNNKVTTSLVSMTKERHLKQNIKILNSSI
ncbi:MAG: aldo/keto reductase [Eubacteriales bacterium]